MVRSGPVTYDAELRLHDEVLRRACGVQPHEQVLDIGCGLGQTTCEAARLARAGSADPAAVEHALGRLREMLAGHLSGDGVWFDSRAWIVSARRH